MARQPGLQLRSFGLYQFGFAHDKLLDDSVNRICRAVVQRLSGPHRAPEQKKPSGCCGGGDARRSTSRAPIRWPISIIARPTLARTMGLDVEPLMQVVQQFAAADLGGDPEAFFRS